MADVKPRLLFIGDAVCHTGFARVTHNVLAHLAEGWDITVLGINYQGDPHPYHYPIYPARLGGDLWGLGRFVPLCDAIRPHLICVLQDPWIAARFATEFERGECPMAAYMPIDAKNQDPRVCAGLNKLDLALFYTRFGEVECRLAGYKGQSAVIPHGVNTSIYRPIDRREARRHMEIDGLPEDAFIIGNVNRNSPRKRLDLTIRYFAEWLRQRAGARDRIANAYLYIHCSQRDTAGLDLAELAHYYGVDNRLIIPDAELVTPSEGLPESEMPYVYNCFDIQVTTTAGEGWGLCQLEGAACGIPQIVPQFSALGEWMAGSAYMIPCDGTVAHPVVNTVGSVPNGAEFIRALDLFYRKPELRSQYAAKALMCARKPEYRWKAIAGQFNHELMEMLIRARARAAEKKETANHAEVPEDECVANAS